MELPSLTPIATSYEQMTSQEQTRRSTQTKLRLIQIRFKRLASLLLLRSVLISTSLNLILVEETCLGLIPQ